MVSNVFSTIGRYGEYGANFLLGTGSTRMGKEIGKAVQARKRANMSFTTSIGAGFSKGLKRSNAEMVKSGGFFKSLGKAFSELPKNMSAGWKSGTGKNGFTKFFSSLGKSLKPLGKIMPFAFNALWLAQSIPDIVARTKDEGIWGGIKETGKALANMAVISVAAAAGATFGFAGMIGLPIAASMAFNMIMGEPYKAKKEAEAEALKKQEQEQNPFIEQPTVGQKLDITSTV